MTNAALECTYLSDFRGIGEMTETRALVYAIIDAMRVADVACVAERELDAALERALSALDASDEPRAYVLMDAEGGTTRAIVAESDEAAEEAAADWARSGDWGEVTSTIWVDVHIHAETAMRQPGMGSRLMDACITTTTVSIDPPEPACEEGDDGRAMEHEWSDSRVRGHGGGVILVSRCAHCGVSRTTDTWAQRPDDGTQGHESVTYEAAE